MVCFSANPPLCGRTNAAASHRDTALPSLGPDTGPTGTRHYRPDFHERTFARVRSTQTTQQTHLQAHESLVTPAPAKLTGAEHAHHARNRSTLMRAYR